MGRPTKQSQQLHLKEVIKETAWLHISIHGSQRLSLRSIARDISISPPAIYHYFPSREALLTELIIEAYNSLAIHQQDACDAVSSHDAIAQLRAIGIAYRKWARTFPQHYQLIFGTPIPDYQAPKLLILPAAARSLGVLIHVIERLHQQGKLNPASYPTLQSPNKSLHQQWQQYVGACHIQSFVVAELIWARVHGLASLEIGGNLPLFSSDEDTLYDTELDAMIRHFVTE